MWEFGSISAPYKWVAKLQNLKQCGCLLPVLWKSRVSLSLPCSDCRPKISRSWLFDPRNPWNRDYVPASSSKKKKYLLHDNARDSRIKSRRLLPRGSHRKLNCPLTFHLPILSGLCLYLIAPHVSDTPELTNSILTSKRKTVVMHNSRVFVVNLLELWGSGF